MNSKSMVVFYHAGCWVLSIDNKGVKFNTIDFPNLDKKLFECKFKEIIKNNMKNEIIEDLNESS